MTRKSLTTVCWLLLAVLHVTPAAAFFQPHLIQTLYGVSTTATAGILLTHRGALFLAVCLAALTAAFRPGARPLACTVVSVSMLGFLVTYYRAGAPAGPLRTIAVADVAGLLPLLLVAVDALQHGRTKT